MIANERGTVFIHASWLDALKMLPDGDLGRLVIALLNYSNTGKAAKLEGAAGVAFNLIKAFNDDEEWDEEEAFNFVTDANEREGTSYGA